MASATKTVLATAQRELGAGAVQLSNDEPTIEVISTGFEPLNEALSIGGYPRGRIIEIFGPESAGKSTLVLHALREAQGQAGLAALVDADRAFDARYARSLGLDLDRLLISRPEHAEQALDLVELLARSGDVALIAVDSAAALAPKAETEARMGDDLDHLQARLLARALRKLTGVAHQTKTTLLFVNQMRHARGVMFGSPEVPTGGHALRHFASLRLDVRRVGPVKQGEQLVGERVRLRILKHKLGVPFRETDIELKWATEQHGSSPA